MFFFEKYLGFFGFIQPLQYFFEKYLGKKYKKITCLNLKEGDSPPESPFKVTNRRELVSFARGFGSLISIVFSGLDVDNVYRNVSKHPYC